MHCIAMTLLIIAFRLLYATMVFILPRTLIMSEIKYFHYAYFIYLSPLRRDECHHVCLPGSAMAWRLHRPSHSRFISWAFISVICASVFIERAHDAYGVNQYFSAVTTKNTAPLHDAQPHHYQPRNHRYCIAAALMCGITIVSAR